MTTKSLAARFPTRALACQDREDFRFDNVHVRAFGNSRLRFVAEFALASIRATHIVHDFVGTARAQRFSLGRRSRNAVWAHGIEVWGDLRREHAEALRRSDLVLVNSAYTLERAQGALAGARNVRLCHLGTTSDDAPDFVGIAEGPPTVLLLGRIDPRFPKGHDLLVSIWPRVVSAVADARLVFVGGGPALTALRDLVAQSPVAASIERRWLCARSIASTRFGDARRSWRCPASRKVSGWCSSRRCGAAFLSSHPALMRDRKSISMASRVSISIARDRINCQI